MAKSKYAEQLNRGKPFLEEICDEQIGRLQRSSVKDKQPLLRDWEQLAGAENSVKERYRGRYLFELLQNANDAIVEAEARNGQFALERHLVRLELTAHSLLVANYGQPFAEENVRSLCLIYKSTKHSISKQIGHKGIGFKSVLEICQYPEVYSDIYAFGYDGQQFRRDIEDVLRNSYNSDLPTLVVPYHRHINQLPSADRERIETLFEDGYVTVIRLPLDNPALADEVAQRLEKDITPQLLLFLTAITQIEIAFPDGREVSFYRQPHIHHPVSGQDQLSLVALRRDDEYGDALDSRWLILGPIERSIPDRSLVEEIENEAWRDVTAVRFSLLFPLDEKEKRAKAVSASFPFHVYFPTEEPSGLRFIVHGDFHVGDDRKTIPLNRLNKWLMEEICAYLAGEGTEVLKQYWGHNEMLVDLLAPLNQPEREFARFFMDKYLGYLQIAPFVPVDGGQYKTPDKIRIPPAHADETLFRQLFPASRLRQTEKWAYPLPDVVTAERERRPPFLLSPQLGGQEVQPELVIGSLKRDGMPPLTESPELLDFLAEWYGNLREERQAFLELLQDVPIFPAVSGWRKPDEGLVFQANLRPDVADFQVPAGFEFAVIRRAVYPEQGTRSPVFKLFEDLGARPYSARAILRDAILSVLVSNARFTDLRVHEPEAIYGAYRILNDYFQDDGATTDRIGELLPRVPVPARNSRGELVWKKAGDCYFGRSWPSGNALERLYGTFEDCHFLAEIPQLVSEESERQSWFSLFRWLGVLERPQLIENAKKVARDQKITGAGLSRWSEYMRHYRAGFQCKHATRKHGASRQLQVAHSLHHFDELVAQEDVTKLLDLYRLLGQNWAFYRPYCEVTLSCKYVSYDCPQEKIENYFWFVLRRSNWLPTQIGETWTEPLSPHHIWLIGETEPTDVRRLVPTLPAEWRTGSLRDLALELGFISSGTAQVEDYIRLLQLLPERYPLVLAGAEEKEVEQWQKSVRVMFNWICERLQTGLVSRGENAPECPANLTLLAYRDGRLDYVPVTAPELVYPNDNYLAQRWEHACAYVRLNDDWRRLQSWLKLRDLTAVIESEWDPQGELVDETRKVRDKFTETLPYYLTLIRQAQPANYGTVLPRMRRLRLHVVKRLTVTEYLPQLPEVAPLVSQEKVHLEQGDELNPGVGRRQVRAGDLYITREALSNLDLLGEYIANYIEISRMGDAFIILIHRDEDGKLRFLQSRGLTAEDVQQVYEEWQDETEERENPHFADTFLQKLLQAKRNLNPQGIIPTAPAVDQVTQENAAAYNGAASQANNKEDKDAGPKRPDYPPLNLEKETGVQFTRTSDRKVDKDKAPGKRKGGNGGGRTGSIVSSEVTEELGHRGEEWAYAQEKSRLRDAGFDPAELEAMNDLVWVSDKKPMANHDILSIRVTDTGEQRPVFIEVKSSVGDGRYIKMSRSEFQLAMHLREDYWLYWVANVDEAEPDPPICYPNIAKLLADEKIEIDVDTIAMRLPQPEDELNEQGDTI